MTIELFQIYNVGRETVILLLECNPDIGPLLDWVVDRCYTGTAQVADGCFLALATIFSARLVLIRNYYFTLSKKSWEFKEEENDRV